MIKKDYGRLSQLIQRGSKINHQNPKNGFTPLHLAIERNLESKMIKFLLRHDADPHVEDINGLDSCDKGKKK